MIRAKQIFGKHAFRKSYDTKRKTPINKALFEVWTVLLSELNDSKYNALERNKVSFLSEYTTYLEDNDFIYTISRDSLKVNSVHERYKRLSELLRKYVK
jgi:hypothetical protein